MPFIGDVRLIFPERDAELPFSKITAFEVWDGIRWIGADEDGRLRLNVQAPSDAKDWFGSRGS